MTLPQIISRNQIQKIPTIALNTRLVGASLIFYTCPTGKRAIITGMAMCTGLGAAAEVRLEANAIEVINWVAATVDDAKFFECSLEADETLAKDQNSGTNGEVNVTARILETPI